MVNTKDIAHFIQHPEAVQREHLEGLKNLASKYPYTQLFSILYLKGLSQTGALDFEDELLLHSYRIADRTLLYHLIHDQSKQEEMKRPTDEIASVLESEEDVTATDPMENLAHPSPSSNLDAVLLTQESETPTPEEEQEKVVDTRSDESLEVATEHRDETNDHLEETILHHAFAANYELPPLTEEEAERLKEKEEQSKLNEARPSSVLEFTEAKNEDPQESNVKPSFTSWLSANTRYEEAPNTDRALIESIVSGFQHFNPAEGVFGEIQKPKKEFFSPVKKAKESLDESTLPVSETLAKIYAVQGNYPKAIQAYEQLSLKYPEKKIFFANQIKELKNKINTQ